MQEAKQGPMRSESARCPGDQQADTHWLQGSGPRMGGRKGDQKNNCWELHRM